MRIEVSVGKRLMIQENKKKFLFSTFSCRLYVIDYFVIDEVEESRTIKHMFAKPETVVETHYYLTEMKIKSYHSTGKFCGYITGDSVKEFLIKDLYYLRQNWLDLKDMFKAFNLEVVNTEKIIIEPEYSI
jgi:hypothetical protein